MEFDAYWSQLVDRVYKEKERLAGDEAFFYRISCIFGETMVDGIESYFERRYMEFEDDMAALVTANQQELFLEFTQARKVLFGEQPLTEDLVDPLMDRLLDEDPALVSIQSEIDLIYDRVIPLMDGLDDYKYNYGLEKNFYSETSP